MISDHTPVRLTAELVEAFSGTFLSPMYDEAKPTPPFHVEGWELYCSTAIQAAIAAPREHAKSTAFTHDFVLANCLFRVEDYIILVSSNEEMAIEHLSDISREMRENEDLIAEFEIKRFIAEAKTDIIVEMADGHEFRIIARGSGQKMRGRKWKGKRPGLIVCHEKGTLANFGDNWIPIEEHPTAKVHSCAGVRVEVVGIPWAESVTPEHRYWVQQIRQKKKCRYEGGKKVEHWTEYQKTFGWKEAHLLLAQDSGIGDWIGSPICRDEVLPDINLPIDHPDFWWLVGLWWGDGSADYNDPKNHHLSWALAVTDTTAVEKLRSVAAFFGLHITEVRHEAYTQYMVNWPVIVDWLKGWKGTQAGQKTPPLWVEKIPLSLQVALIQGYIEADGYVTDREVKITSVSVTELLSLRRMLARLGIVGFIRRMAFEGENYIKGRLVACQDKYDLRFQEGAEILGISVNAVERYALRRAFVAGDWLWSKVERVSATLTERQYVPVQTEDHTYLTDFGLSHNCDDLEDDEQVESLERRVKFRRWFFRALKPALRDGGKLRIHGTILADDSLLNRLMKDPTWATLFYKAHESFDDFSNILWEEKFPARRLKSIRDSFVSQGDAAGYSQEYLNDPFDNSEAFLRREDFLEMTEDDRDEPKIFFAGADFAASKADRANRTSYTIAGKDIQNRLHFVDERAGRWDMLESLEEIFLIHSRWHPQAWFVEDGVIWKMLWPMMKKEMAGRDTWINFIPITPIKDKGTRGKSFQRRMRGGGCRFDKKADWYPGFEGELLRFTGIAQATLDDQFDSSAIISRGLDSYHEVDEEDFQTDEELEFFAQSKRVPRGRSLTTGY